jgi:hypothetical protein
MGCKSVNSGDNSNATRILDFNSIERFCRRCPASISHLPLDTANTVAADYYDVFPRKNASSNKEGFLFAVADVAGKSIPAALLMATFQASLKTPPQLPARLLN